MIPSIDTNFMQNIKTMSYPSLTYKISEDGTRMQESVDGMEALKQSIYLILNTERYAYLIYSWNYGVELCDKIGSNMQLECLAIKTAICDALMQDDRITSVDNFNFSQSKKILNISFTVHSTFGDTESEVKINV